MESVDITEIENLKIELADLEEQLNEKEQEIEDLQEDYGKYDDWLDGLYGEINIGNSVFSASKIIKEFEPTTYDCGFNDYLDEALSGREAEKDDILEEIIDKKAEINIL